MKLNGHVTPLEPPPATTWPTGSVFQCQGGKRHHGKGALDMFVASFGPGGEHRWSRAFGGARSGYSNSATAEGIAVDALGRATVIGSFRGAIDFDGETVSTAGEHVFSQDLVLFKL